MLITCVFYSDEKSSHSGLPPPLTYVRVGLSSLFQSSCVRHLRYRRATAAQCLVIVFGSHPHCNVFNESVFCVSLHQEKLGAVLWEVWIGRRSYLTGRKSQQGGLGLSRYRLRSDLRAFDRLSSCTRKDVSCTPVAEC